MNSIPSTLKKRCSYSEVFGWKIDSPQWDYWQVTTGTAAEDGINGGIALGPADYPHGIRVTIEVDALELYISKAVENGAKVIRDRMEFEDFDLAYLEDPTGLGIGLIQRRPHPASPIQNRLGGVFLHVRDIFKARDWYCTILGLPADGEIQNGHIYVLPMKSGPSLILDTMPMWNDHRFDHSLYAHTPAFMFITEDIEASYQFLKENQVELVTEIQNHHWFTFRDPDGNLLMVCQSQHGAHP